MRYRADLGRDGGVLRAELVADDVVDEPVCVEVSGVDVIDPEVDGHSEEPAGSGRVAVEPLELHGAVPDAGHVAARVLPGAAGLRACGGTSDGHSRVFLLSVYEGRVTFKRGGRRGTGSCRLPVLGRPWAKRCVG